MLKNYLKIAWRSLVKNRVTAIINILGLSVGISAALIIFMVVHYNFSFDRFVPGRDYVYRIVTEGEGWNNSGVPVPFHTALHNISGVAGVTPILNYSDKVKISINEGNNTEPKLFRKQTDVAFTNMEYFKIFPHKWIAGNQQKALGNPYSIVITNSRAKQYFPDLKPENVIGKTVILNDTITTTVTGIVNDLEVNSDFDKMIFVSLPTATLGNLKDYFNWKHWDNTNSSFQTIIKLLPGIKPEQINNQLAKVFKERDPGNTKTIHRLQPLSDVHTNPVFGGSANPETMRNLVILGAFLLLLGAINFINLSTAHASERSKEIGIRKTLGSTKKQIVFQFLSETFLLTVLTALLAIVLIPLLLKGFEGFVPEGLHFNYFLQQPFVWLFLLVLIIAVSVLSGLYPAFVLTTFKPVLALKSNLPAGDNISRGVLLRKTLIVSQFVIAQVFIIGVFVVNKQIRFSLQKDMGFRKNAIINFYPPFDWYNPNNKKFLLKDALSKIPEIQKLSFGNQSPAFNGYMTSSITYKENNKNQEITVNTRNGDTSFLSVYDIKLLAGRNILLTDTANELLVNETLSKQLGFKEPSDAVGHFVFFNGAPKPIVGVMTDFNLQSVRNSINPLIYYASPKNAYVMHIALQPDPATWKTAISKMEKAWKQIYPDQDFEYTFLDKTIENFYKEDQQLSKLLTWSAAVALFISSLGLLGLVIFITNKRIKEIGIRKVLGASVRQIIALLSTDFVKLLILAFIIATPIAWWQMHGWLQNFAYRTNLSWWIFLVSGVIMIVISLIILGIRAGSAAVENPVKLLRTE
ncbi:ABC transporter permease [Agriterribacter humi]|uniref:ABC transporter permease n=1 Tax=Agriterribacter humi TaxID=1104781 RepID=UPI0012642801|nr:ABC transporter permease [Agriterribacter humi]